MAINPSDRSETYRIKLSLNLKNDARIIASEFIKPGSQVLDVGCACGDFGVFLKEQLGCEMYGMEYNQDSISIAESTYAYKAIHLADLEKFEHNKYAEYTGYFDFIVVLDVLEHIRFPEDVLSALAMLLKPNGRFVISLPNVAFCEVKAGLLCGDFEYAEMGILDKTHIKFYTFKSISTLLTSVRLSVEDCKSNIRDWGFAPAIPRSSKRMIDKSPHSFVYQYIILASQSADSNNVLANRNLEKFASSVGNVKPSIRRMRFSNAMIAFFPVGTRRNRIARIIQALLFRAK